MIALNLLKFQQFSLQNVAAKAADMLKQYLTSRPNDISIFPFDSFLIWLQ